MKTSKVDLTFPCVRTIPSVRWDESGFREGDREEPILWADIEQVALIFEMTPTIAIIEPETYIAFRLKSPDLSVWVFSTFEDLFAEEIGRRFAPTIAPPVARWHENDRCIVSYTIWPQSKTGEPLYLNYRKHWWSSNASLAFRKKPNQSLEPTPMLGTSAAEQPLVPSTGVAHL